MKIKQKKISFFFLFALFLSSCSNSDDLAMLDELDDSVMLNENNSAQFERLSFSNEEDLLSAILDENASLRSSLTQNNSFISLMDKMPEANLRSDSDHGVTYYESLGFGNNWRGMRIVKK